MVYHTFYYLHVGSLIIWIGAFIALGLLLISPQTVKNASQDSLLYRSSDLVLKIFAPLSFITLVAGVYLILQTPEMYKDQIWLVLKERVGGVLLLFTMFWMSRKANVLRKSLKANADQTIVAKNTKSFAVWMLVLAVAAFGIVLLASFKFGS
ncbi:MAG: hypothetical protein ACRCWQ_13435 [Bacilli bacterium]